MQALTGLSPNRVQTTFARALATHGQQVVLHTCGKNFNLNNHDTSGTVLHSHTEVTYNTTSVGTSMRVASISEKVNNGSSTSRTTAAGKSDPFFLYSMVFCQVCQGIF